MASTARSLLLLVAVLALSSVAFCTAASPVLAFRSHGIINEGQVSSLEGMVDVAGLELEAPVVVESWQWDLDGDQVFGETGSDASRGQEEGRFVKVRANLLNGASSFIVRARATIRIGERLLNLEGQHEVSVGNQRPEVTVASEFQAVGSSAQLTASCADPGDDATSVEWDLDNDGLFGETGHAALAGDETGASVRFGAAVDPTTDRTARVRVQCRDAEGAASKIASSIVRILALERSCVCPLPAPVPFKQFHLFHSAKFDTKDRSKIVLTSSSVSSQGAVFHPTPVTVGSSFEACATFRLEDFVADASADSTADLSLVFVPEVPTTLRDLSRGVASLPAASGITLRFSRDVEPSVQLATSTASSTLSHAAGIAARDRNSHFLSLRFINQRVTVWVDGVEVADEEFDLFPASLFNSNAFVGFVAHTTAPFTQQLSVDAAIRSCQVAEL